MRAITLCAVTLAAAMTADAESAQAPSYRAPMPVGPDMASMSAVSAGKIDLDDISDFVVAAKPVGPGSAEIRVFHGNGFGGFSPPLTLVTTNSFADDVRLADFEPDGRADIITASHDGDSVTIYSGGDFASYRELGTLSLPNRVVTGDIDRNGKPDFVTANSGTLTVYFNTGDLNFPGGFYRVDYLEPGAGRDIQLGDVDGDEFLDIVFTVTDRVAGEYQMVGVKLYVEGDVFDPNVGVGAFGPTNRVDVDSEPYVGEKITALALGNINERHLDIIGTKTWADAALRLLGKGNGRFEFLVEDPVRDNPVRVLLTRLDEDAELDMAIAYANDGVDFFFGDGAGNMVGPYTVLDGTATVLNDIALSDFNRDGKTDVVLATARGVYVMLSRNEHIILRQ